MSEVAQEQVTVTLTIDGKEVTVPKGTVIIEAAKQAGIEIPFYCYHPHLSIPGNCRMCQVEVEGAPKLMIGCHTQVAEGMIVKTHNTSTQVENAQASTLEMLLINHPLDCTVCDQAGHCKLQDYHYEYNARSSRFLEKKEKKVKAEVLGPTVILDGERCIACTRCVRFCDEITETGELGLLNRGDRYVIAVNEGHELNNPLSGTVVDLCPVGALTHRKWRFNTRMWYTQATETICPGCSTGCNAKVHVRDDQVVQVKARLNSEVNKEWMCDEGRYGFDRFLPKERCLYPTKAGLELEWDAAFKELSNLKNGKSLILAAPDLLLEEFYLLKLLCDRYLPDASRALAYRERSLTPVEAILISPDYAANFQGAIFSGYIDGGESLEQQLEGHVKAIKQKKFDNILFVGDRSLTDKDQADTALLAAINEMPRRFGILSDRESPLASLSQLVFPARSILEKSGLLINRAGRLQFSAQSIDFPIGSEPEWRILNRFATALGSKFTEAENDRELTRWYLKQDPRVQGLSIAAIKNQLGIDLEQYQPQEAVA